MPLYEHRAHQGQYLYRMRYTEHPEGWMIDAAQVVWNDVPLNAWTEIKGLHGSEAQALARGIEWCEAIVAHHNTDNVPDE